MRHWSLIIYAGILFGGPLFAATPEAIRLRRIELEGIFEREAGREFDFFRRSATGAHCFLPNHTFEPNSDRRLARLARQFSQQLVKLAESALQSNHGALAYELLNEAAFFADGTVADIVLNCDQHPPDARVARNRHSQLRWKAGEYFRVSTRNFQVVTRDRLAGIEIANRLETLRAVWVQRFFDFWSNAQRLSTAMDQARPLMPTRRRLHRVILFADRDEYLGYLRAKHPRIAISLGYYDVDSQTSFFCTGEDAPASTQLHEVTHQLFQEIPGTVRRQRWDTNAWALEGVAMYMESMQERGPIATVGGFQSYRLQFARFRRLQEQFYVPLAELISMGRDEIQRHPEIRRIYSQSAGLAHFFIDSGGGQYGAQFIDYLKGIYGQPIQQERLSKLVDRDLGELDLEYAQFLNVQDEDVLATVVTDDSLRALCLGDTRVTERIGQHLGKQSNLDWLDLARTKVGDDGLSFLQGTRSLRQVNLDGTPITDKSMELLLQNSQLEELDLSNTRVTDEGVTKLGPLQKLKVLWLSNTAVTDRAIATLGQLKSLQQLSLDGTKISQAGRKVLHDRLPQLVIH